MYATLSLHVAMKEVLWSQIRTDSFEWFTLARKVKVFQNYYNVNIAWQHAMLSGNLGVTCGGTCDVVK